MSIVMFRPKMHPQPPQCWRAVCQALQWNEKVCAATWATMLGSTDPYLKGTSGSLLLLQQRLQYLTYDDLVQAVRRHITPRTLAHVLQASVKNGTVKRPDATILEDRILACVSADGQWRE